MTMMVGASKSKMQFLRLRPSGFAQDDNAVEGADNCIALAFCGADGFGELGDDLEEVAYDAVVGYFKDGSVFVFVDGDDGFGALHADEVLDGSGDAYCEVE